MNAPRRHHYVPQFHQRRFVDGASDRIWIWDRTSDRVFSTTPGSIAVESDFYRLHEYEALGHDPYVLEKQLAEMEAQISLITGQWLDWLRAAEIRQSIPIPEENRYYFSRFMAVQFLRTADTREILCAFHEQHYPEKKLSQVDQTNLHIELLWDPETVERIANFLKESIWIFARNQSMTPYWTSDNPVAFRTADNSMWVKAGFLTDGTYAVYPLAPDIVLYCHSGSTWNKLRQFDNTLSPVTITRELVESENTGQVFMAKRFVISPTDDFSLARRFAPTIGTDTYKSGWLAKKSKER
ncbi:MAG: DUF4238 domain-containing protein [Alphaproteobacteria bacterium]|nr:DUF4238 domain-containing protein [Alphaproteobacteria bacterium]MBM3642427.1 DUF4238 domain-containing protein [Alphaproteobacteria bacterium]